MALGTTAINDNLDRARSQPAGPGAVSWGAILAGAAAAAALSLILLILGTASHYFARDNRGQIFGVIIFICRCFGIAN